MRPLAAELAPPQEAALRYPLGAGISADALLADPYPAYRACQEREPVTWVAELGMWWVVRFEDVIEILADDHAFTTASPDSLIFDTFGRQMLSTDGDEHMRYRRAARADFQPQALRARLEQEIRHWTDALIDGFSAGAAELRAQFAAQLPIRITLALLGLPQSAAPRLRRWYDAFEAALANFGRDPAVRAQARTCVGELHALLAEALDEARRVPSAGLVAALSNQTGEARLSDEEICRNASIVMFGGISTVEALILNSVWTLAVHPVIEARVRADLSLVPRVIEEVLRWQSPVQSATRHVTRDVEFRGHHFRAGDTVNCMLAAANRDANFLADADTFDVDREPAPRHLAFAAGPHFCLGLHLARMVGRTALERLYSRLPGFRVEAPQSHRPRGYEFRQPPRLPVTWDTVPIAASMKTGGATG